jgi:hypothetical protein
VIPLASSRQYLKILFPESVGAAISRTLLHFAPQSNGENRSCLNAARRRQAISRQAITWYLFMTPRTSKKAVVNTAADAAKAKTENIGAGEPDPVPAIQVKRSSQ